MDIVNICPACKESISTTPLVDILVTYQEDLTREEIYEQGWHKKCYPPAPAPALLAVLTGLLDALDRQYSEPDPERFYPGTTEYVLDNERIAARATVAEARGEAV